MIKQQTISPQEKKIEAPIHPLIPPKEKAFLDLLADMYTQQIVKKKPLILEKTNSK